MTDNSKQDSLFNPLHRMIQIMLFCVRMPNFRVLERGWSIYCLFFDTCWSKLSVCPQKVRGQLLVVLVAVMMASIDGTMHPYLLHRESVLSATYHLPCEHMIKLQFSLIYWACSWISWCDIRVSFACLIPLSIWILCTSSFPNNVFRTHGKLESSEFIWIKKNSVAPPIHVDSSL